MDVTIPCVCPPKADGQPRHEQDTITFRDRLDFEGGMVIRKAIVVLKTEDPDSEAAEVLAAMAKHYFLQGVEAWTLVDAKGKPEATDKPALRRFLAEHPDIVMDHVVDAADALYYEQALAPLLRRAQASSQPTPTEPSTSAGIGSTKRKPSRRSSTTTTPTDDTGPITLRPVGDSSTSRKSA